MALAVIEEGMYVVLDCGEDASRQFLRIQKGRKARMGKALCDSGDLIGHPFGAIFVVDRSSANKQPKLMRVPASEMVDPEHATPDEQPSKDNRDIKDDGSSQSLTAEQVEQMKRDMHDDADALIKTIAQHNTQFELKTEFSKAKYVRRKKAKYRQLVHLLQPSIKNIARSFYIKKPDRIMHLRVDSLSQMMTSSNVRPGSNTLVFETALGLVTGAVASKQGPTGQIMHAFANQQAVLDAVKYFNLSPETLGTILPFSLSLVGQLHKPNTAEDDAKFKFPEGITKVEDLPPIQQRRYYRPTRGALKNKLRAGADSLLICSEYDPEHTLWNLLPLLKGGAPFVVFCHKMEPLSRCAIRLKRDHLACNIRMSETWMRDYQVLPQRTHPKMNMDAAGGFLLFGIKLLSDEEGDQQAAAAAAPVSSPSSASPPSPSPSPSVDDESPPAKKLKTEETK